MQKTEKDTAIKHENLAFSQAFDFVNQGYKIRRESWGAKGAIWVELPPSSEEGDQEEFSFLLCVLSAGQEVIIPWEINQTDLLATDWIAVLDDSESKPLVETTEPVVLYLDDTEYASSTQGPLTLQIAFNAHSAINIGKASATNEAIDNKKYTKAARDAFVSQQSSVGYTIRWPDK